MSDLQTLLDLLEQPKVIAPIPDEHPFDPISLNGVLSGLTNKFYHESPGLSRSGIMMLLKAPIYYWSKYINLQEEEEKDHFNFGTALHSLVLEPQIFDMEYFIMEKMDRRTKAGKDHYETCLEVAGERSLLTEDIYSELKKIREEIYKNPYSTELLNNTEREKSIYWTDEETGILCKARPDFMFLGKDIQYVGDIKTTNNASPYNFGRDMQSYGYHVQAAMIQEGILKTKGILVETFYAVVVEKEAPYVTSIYIISKESIEVGKAKFRHGLKVYKECVEKNMWPGYPIQEVSLPAYAFYE